MPFQAKHKTDFCFFIIILMVAYIVKIVWSYEGEFDELHRMNCMYWCSTSKKADSNSAELWTMSSHGLHSYFTNSD